MNDFESCYRSAVQDIVDKKEIHIDAQSCMDRKRHKRRVARQLGRSVYAILSAASLLLVCGLGTVKAATYLRNIIRVKEWGFMSGDAATVADQENQVWVIKEELEAVSEKKEKTEEIERNHEKSISAEVVSGCSTKSPAETAPHTETAHTVSDEKFSPDAEATTEATESVNNRIVSESTEETGINPQTTAETTETSVHEEEKTDFLLAEGIPVTQDTPVAQESGKQEEELSFLTTSEAKEMMEEEILTKTYYSIQEFQENEKIVFPQPSLPIPGTVEIVVCDTWAMSRYDTEGRILWLERTDYADTQGHSASKVFPEGVHNERTYTNTGGYTYTLVDSVQTDQQEPLRIHGAIAVGTYEVFIDFYGYTEEEAKQIIDSIDLSLYETAEG